MKKVFYSVLSLPLLFSVGGVSASAGLAYPNLAGSRYCALRSTGVDYDTALHQSIQAGWDRDYIDTKVIKDGKSYHQSTVDMYDYVEVMCPEYLDE